MSRQHAKTAAQQPRRSAGTYLWIGFGLLAVALFVGIIISASSRRSTRVPAIGDHWHARYAIEICGTPLPPFRASPGGVHTHGDGAIHIHPANSSEQGSNANLARFLASVGVTLTRDAIQLPGGATYRNGDKCPGGAAGTVRLLVNGAANDVFERYVMQNNDTVVIAFR